MEAGRNGRRGRVAAGDHGQRAGLAGRVAVADPVEVGVDPVATVGHGVAVGVVVRAGRLRLERGDEFVVVARVGVEGRLDPGPGGVAVRVRAVRPEPELGDQARRGTRLVRDAVDPDLAVGVVGPIDGRDGVRHRRRPLEVGPADGEVRQADDLVRRGARIAGGVERANDDVVTARILESVDREGRARDRGSVRLDVAAARERADPDVVAGGAPDGVPGDRDLIGGLARDVEAGRRRRWREVDLAVARTSPDSGGSVSSMAPSTTATEPEAGVPTPNVARATSRPAGSRRPGS